MSLKIGIVGLPNVGKSTLFNALLKRQQALVANYPFATIEPNIGVVEVPDGRLSVLAGISRSDRIVPATVEFVDIAGLVAGASSGAGLGNKFLTHIRDVDVVLHVMRDFRDSGIVKEGSVDPETDYQVIEMELILKDLDTVARVREGKELRTKGLEKKKEVVEKLYAGLNEGKSAREIFKNEEDRELARDLFLLTAKKEIRVYNVSEDDKRLKEPVGEGLYICAKIESELSSLSEDDAIIYLKELGIRGSGLDLLIQKAYSALGLISFLTTGEIESRAWTTTKNAKAPQAAAVIHTDFEKKFIKAKVCDFEKFVEAGGWKGAGDKGWVRFEGKDYEIKDGDVVEFMIGS